MVFAPDDVGSPGKLWGCRSTASTVRVRCTEQGVVISLLVHPFLEFVLLRVQFVVCGIRRRDGAGCAEARIGGVYLVGA